MSASVFPTLAGLGWSVDRTEIWSNQNNPAVSGKETRTALWTYPRHQWDLKFDILRQGSVNGSTYTEFAQLAGFFNQRQGSFDSFLYEATDDNAVTAQPIGTGDGSTKTFQLIRAFGGFLEPVLAPNVVSNIYLNGVNQASGWSVSSWGSATPGLVTFASAPGSGVTISGTFSFYFPVRFVDDSMSFSNFLKAMYDAKKVSFLSIK